jgi:hypothetical protein
MDGPRFPLYAVRPRPTPTRLALSRRQALRALGGLAVGLAASRGAVLPQSAAARPISQRTTLTNPASRVLLPGEAGLRDFGFDFTLCGPPAVFFASTDTPGWSYQVKSSVGGFVFGYAATLAAPAQASGDTGRAVQVCVHHGFPSQNDANVAWASLTAALAAGSDGTEKVTVRSLDVVEAIDVNASTILATVAGGDLDAVVLASRSDDDLVTVAIADFTGKTPNVKEALRLADAEGKKRHASRSIQRTDLGSAFQAQWTPGFQLGSGAGAPFFAWPTVMNNAPIALAGESGAQFDLRRQMNAAVSHQSHVEGPFWEANPLFAGHGLYYSGESNFFGSSSAAQDYHGQTRARLQASMPHAAITTVKTGRTEHRLAYEVQTSAGRLAGIMLHTLVPDGDFPLSLALHVVAVPAAAGEKAPAMDVIIGRLDPLLRRMRSGLKSCLVAPSQASLMVSVATA